MRGRQLATGATESIPRNVPAFGCARRAIARAASATKLQAEVSRAMRDDIDPGKDGREPCARYFANAPSKNLSVERDDLGNVGYGRLCEAGISRGEEHVPGRLGPLDLRSERHADHGRESASVQRVRLNDEHRSAKTRPRANGVTEGRPPNFPLSDHHSEPFRTLRAAPWKCGSGSPWTAAHARLNESVTASGE